MALDITERVIGAVSARTVQAIVQRQGTLAYDVSIAEIPFVYAITDSVPYTRETIEFKKQQIDTSPEPGEQSLSQWWVRDQDSWHRGSGINWYDPGSDGTTRYRYHESLGINPWTRGEIKLHKAMAQQKATSGGQSCYACSAVVNGADAIFAVVGGGLYMYNGVSETAYSSTPTPNTEPVVAGAKVLVGSTAGVLAGDVNGSSLTTLWTTSTGNTARPFWAKNRIICALGNCTERWHRAHDIFPTLARVAMLLQFFAAQRNQAKQGVVVATIDPGVIDQRWAHPTAPATAVTAAASVTLKNLGPGRDDVFLCVLVGVYQFSRRRRLNQILRHDFGVVDGTRGRRGRCRGRGDGGRRCCRRGGGVRGGRFRCRRS